MPNIAQLHIAPFRGLIGSACRPIYPPPGIRARNWGAARQDLAQGTHGSLTLNAISFRTRAKEDPLVLVEADLGWWQGDDEQRLRNAILKATGLSEDRLMFSLTHTHAAPSLCSGDRNLVGGYLIEPFLEMLANEAIEAIAEAFADERMSVLDWAYGSCELARNRDFQPPGSPRVLTGYNPDGTADSALLIGRVIAKDREPIIIINYACHPTTLAWQNTRISPDFVGAARTLVEEATNGLCMFLQGASGELAPRHQYTDDTDVADQNGRALGYAALSTLELMPPSGCDFSFSETVESGAPLAVWKPVKLTTDNTVTASMIDLDYELQSWPSSNELAALEAEECDPAIRERWMRKRRIRDRIGDGPTSTQSFWLWRIGGALLLGHPNEAYSQLQTDLRHAFPGVPFVVMNVVNGHTGYLPPADFYNKDIYPVNQTPFASGSLEKLILSAKSEAARLLELK